MNILTTTLVPLIKAYRQQLRENSWERNLTDQFRIEIQLDFDNEILQTLMHQHQTEKIGE